MFHLYKKCFLALLSFFFPVLSSFAQDVPELIYYKFNAPGATQVNSASSPVSPSGTVQATASVGGTGQFGSALLGAGGINANWPLNLSGAWTMSMWFSGVTNTLSSNYLFGGSGGSTFRAMTGSGLVSGAGNLMIRGTNLTDILINNIFDAAGTPVVVHIVYDPTIPGCRVYVNGTLNGTVAQPANLTLTGTNFTIGAYDVNAGLPGSAKMDEFRLYNRALTASEIGITWDHELPLAPPNNAGIGALLNPSPDVPFCSKQKYDVYVSLVNLGSNALSSAEIHWSLDGVMQPTVLYNGSLPNYKDSDEVFLGAVYFPDELPMDLRAWSELPNGLPDADNTDDTLKVSMKAELPGIVVELPNDTIVCSRSPLMLDPGAYPNQAFYIWNNGRITQSITVEGPGQYYVTVQNIYGCYGSDTIQVAHFPTPVVGGIAVEDKGGGAFEFAVVADSYVDVYQWDFGDGIGSHVGRGPVSYTYLSDGNYTVTLSVSNSCDTTIYTKLLEIESLSIPSLALKDICRIYPNPVSEVLRIEPQGCEILEVGMYDMLGRLLYKDSGKKGIWEVPIKGFPEGIAVLFIKTNKGVQSKSIQIISPN